MRYVRRALQSALLFVVLGPGPVAAQNDPNAVATLLATIRALKLECKVRPVPSRLVALVAASGSRMDDFLPGGRHFPQVQARLAELRPPSRPSRAGFCVGLAERVRTSPLNSPPRTQAGHRGRGRTGLVDLNRAALDELNSLGAGLIGRTIVSGRPYTAAEDLVERRLLNARDFARIRHRLTVH